MSRRLVGAMLVTAGIVFGMTLDRCATPEVAQAATRAESAEGPDDVAAELKVIKTQVKEINKLLQSGTLRVVVVINPDR